MTMRKPLRESRAGDHRRCTAPILCHAEPQPDRRHSTADNRLAYYVAFADTRRLRISQAACFGL